MHAHTDLLNQVSSDLDADTLTLPALPDIAQQVQSAVADPMMTLPRLALIIAKDTALSARLIKIANSAWLGRQLKAENLPQALMRLGFWQIRHVALGMALEGLYQSQNPQVRDEMSRQWQRSIELTAAAVTLLNHYPGEADLHSHTLALACSSSRIGVLPLLAAVERGQLNDMEAYRAAQQAIAVPVGAKILAKWTFNDEIVNLHQAWREGIGSPKPSYLSFMQLAGMLSGQIKVSDLDGVLKLYVDSGCISRVGIWRQPTVQADYQSILSALRD
ncbi:MAG: HDOD domain-containing protein [Firmicutes bacterium]|nr:HDOD domain-containing protein [Bacillota bacterium]